MVELLRSRAQLRTVIRLRFVPGSDELGGIHPLVGSARPPAKEPRTHRASSMKVGDAALQNTKEQRRPFLLGLRGVTANEREHRVLNDVHCFVLIPNGEARYSERAPFHRDQEPIHRYRIGQSAFLVHHSRSGDTIPPDTTTPSWRDELHARFSGL